MNAASEIEHRLYEIEKWSDNEIVERHLCLIPTSKTLWYNLKGYVVFDYNESLNIDSWYYDNENEFTFKGN